MRTKNEIGFKNFQNAIKSYLRLDFSRRIGYAPLKIIDRHLRDMPKIEKKYEDFQGVNEKKRKISTGVMKKSI